MAHHVKSRSGLLQWLEHPLTRGLDVDDPSTSILRRQVIRRKPLLRCVYSAWYRDLASLIPEGEGAMLELGSGAGFLREFLPDLLTSDVLALPGIDLVLDARTLPIRDRALKALIAVNVLHHVPSPRRFLSEAARTVRIGGALLLVEPWLSSWGRFVYRRLHSEPCNSAATSWEFPSQGPLSSANVALPWILFERDRRQFEFEFPCWSLVRVAARDPLAYLLSGGVSLRSLVPDWSCRPLMALESFLNPWADKLGLFATIVLKRTAMERNVEPIY